MNWMRRKDTDDSHINPLWDPHPRVTLHTSEAVSLRIVQHASHYKGEIDFFKIINIITFKNQKSSPRAEWVPDLLCILKWIAQNAS